MDKYHPVMKKICMVSAVFAAFVLGILSISGCAAKVKAKYMEPARFPVSGLNTLGVAPFDYSGCCGKNWGEYVSAKVAEKLGEESFYKIVAGAPKVLEEGSYWQKWCRENKVDGILSGKVLKSSVDRSFSYRTVEENDYTGRYRDRVYVEGGEVRHRNEEIVRTKTRVIPMVRKYAEMKVAVALYAAVNGERLEYKEYSESMSKYEEGELRVRDWWPDEKMLEQLSDKIAKKIASDFLPREKTSDIELEDNSATKDGVKSAKEGDWKNAEASWRNAVANDPQNAAAWYNLGVAAEVAGRYEEAKLSYQRALGIKYTSKYSSAVERIKMRMLGEEKYKSQIEGR